MLDTLPVVLKGFLAIELVHRLVERFVRLTQIEWHHVRIIEIGIHIATSAMRTGNSSISIP